MPRVRSEDELYLSLLGFLHQRPMYGYELHQILSEAAELGLVWRLKQSQLYALLSRLEADGFVTATVELQGTKAPRKVFALTLEGQRAYAGWVQNPVTHGRDFRIEFLAKLYFARQGGADVAQRLIAEQRKVCLAMLAELRAQSSELQERRPYDWLVLQFRSGQLEAILSWLDLCSQTISALGNEP